MKDTCSSSEAKPMSLKKLDDQTSRDFWEFVKKSADEWRAQQPSWSRELEPERRTQSEAVSEPNRAGRHLNCQAR